MIICFANQKGGVGKSTLATLYANHLAEEGKNVIIFETDIQRSILSQRNDDIKLWGEGEEKYDIRFFNLKNESDSTELMRKAHEILDNMPDATIILDVPGNITEDYLVPIFVHSDYLAVPFFYEKITLNSTSVFIMVIDALRNKYKEMNTKMVFIPNMVKKNAGTKEELAIHANCDDIFRRFGELAPKIYDRMEFKRMNTIQNTPKQREESEKCFGFLDTLFLQ